MASLRRRTCRATSMARACSRIPNVLCGNRAGQPWRATARSALCLTSSAMVPHNGSPGDTRGSICKPRFHDRGRLRPAWGPEVSARKKVSAIMAVLVMLFWVKSGNFQIYTPSAGYRPRTFKLISGSLGSASARFPGGWDWWPWSGAWPILLPVPDCCRFVRAAVTGQGARGARVAAPQAAGRPGSA